MKKIYKEFLKFWLTMQLPVYGGILYIFLFYFDYIYAWALTNTVFTILMFPFYKKYIF